MNTCLIDGCQEPSRSRGLCLPHYGHYRHKGELELVAAPRRRVTFWGHVDHSGGPDACWPWTAAINGNGYGSLAIARKSLAAHRVAYERTYGPIPEGLTLDHVCHTNDPTCEGGKGCLHRRCCNPRHLEPVTNHENVMRGNSPHAQAARQTHCPQGHEYTPENTVTYPSRPNNRLCLICKRAAGRETMAQRKEQQKLYMRKWRAARRSAGLKP